MKLVQLLDGMEYKVVKGTTETEVTELIYDSRKEIVKDAVFVCISGAVYDGHSFAGAAVKAGAAAIIAEHEVEVPEGVCLVVCENTRKALACMSAAYFGHPARELVTIGITGTKGKTTTAYMIRNTLELAGYKTGLIGTIEAIIGDKHIPANNTTPESFLVQKYFREMLDAGCKCVVMEVSSQGLMLHRVGGFVFDYGIFTNLSPDHIGGNEHKDFEDYLRCKSLLFRQCKVGIVNCDDEHYREITEGCTCQLGSIRMEIHHTGNGVTGHIAECCVFTVDHNAVSFPHSSQIKDPLQRNMLRGLHPSLHSPYELYRSHKFRGQLRTTHLQALRWGAYLKQR